MAKRRRKKRQSKGREINPFILPILAVVAAAIIGIAYWKAPAEKKQQIRQSYDNAVESFKGKVQDRLAEISESPEPATGDRLFSYAGLPKSTTYPYPINVLSRNNIEFESAIAHSGLLSFSSDSA